MRTPISLRTIGIVCLEAMSTEKPVRRGARGVVGFRERVFSYGAHDQNGLHMNGEDRLDLAWGIKETLETPKKPEIGVRMDAKE